MAKCHLVQAPVPAQHHLKVPVLAPLCYVQVNIPASRGLLARGIAACTAPVPVSCCSRVTVSAPPKRSKLNWLSSRLLLMLQQLSILQSLIVGPQFQSFLMGPQCFFVGFLTADLPLFFVFLQHNSPALFLGCKALALLHGFLRHSLLGMQ